MSDDVAKDLGLTRVLNDDGTADPGAAPISADVLLRGYREMRRLRLIDAKMILLQRQGRVGFYGACTGQEAVPIAAGLVLAESDWVFPALREQSVMLVRGFPLTQFIAQVFGNSGDVQKGRQMPSHHSGRSVNQVSWSSCIGPQVPQAVGTAWAMKLRNVANKAVSMGFLGDGATSQPDFHNAMTFAGLYRVPAVIVCQNNHWSISVPTHKQTAAKTIAIKGRAYGVPSVRVDGNDLLAMVNVLGEAVARARRGEGPTFVEALTYRIGAHSTSDDPTRYRDEAEVEAWRKKDPLDRLRKHLVVLGLVDDASDAALEAELTAQINAAVKEVEELPPPDRETLFDDVYADLPWHLREQKAELMASPKAPAHGG
ncbi:MAG: thiamine pyrophosphate-dependent dehydrogenase E1 component subunit alpha [Myxococcales bacterium]|jgi:pyruvate dehydrogenase E1 component alpha subunit/2-oxoisovalerate dehydrogenase E1 component alpha subunit|nr:thiamine pyrophosphate-dependent dehydrogenase E1 component subunit alpha [Myxococcales bacterium]